MAGYLNKVMLIGNLGRDPELSKTTGGNSVCSFSIATTERYTDKQGQKQENVEWHNIVVWGKQAEFVAQYTSKGSSVLVEGKITTRSWDNKEGVKQYRTEVVCSGVGSGVTFLDNKQDGAKHLQQNSDSGQQDNNGGDLPVDEELPF